MPNGYDFNFEDEYGKPFHKMTRSEKDMAILNQMAYLRRRIDSFRWLERLGWVAVVAIPAIAGWLAWLSKCLFGIKV